MRVLERSAMYGNSSARRKIKLDVDFRTTNGGRSHACANLARTLDNRILLQVFPLSVTLIKGRHTHSVSASARAAPSSSPVPTRVIEESAATGVGTLLHTGAVCATEQVRGRLRDGDKELRLLTEVWLEAAGIALRSLDESRGS